MKKGVFILCLAICVLVTLSSVCAGDVNDTAIATSDESQVIEEANDLEVVSSADEEVIASSQGEDVLGATAGTFTELQNKIDNAASDSTITLDKDYNYDEGFKKTGISISKSLTIHGNGHILNGLSKSIIFSISSGTVVLNNIKFYNGFSDHSGGAISVISNEAKLHVKNCVFDKNEVRHGDDKLSPGGSAIYSIGDLTITSCSFTNNVINARAAHGTVYVYKNTLTIDNSKFVNNRVNDGSGGAISISGANLNIKNSIFQNNFACDEGGAISCTGGTVSRIDNTKFYGNFAARGGAITFSYGHGERPTLNINSCVFEKNKAIGSGGAIDLENAKLNCNYVTFKENAVVISSQNDASKGGAIYNYAGDLKISNSKFIKNSPKGKNGAIYNDNRFSPTNCKITNTVFLDVDPQKIKLTLKKVKVKKSAKKLVLKATLKKGNTPLKGKKVKFKFKGKTYKTKTNKKGVAKVTIKKKVLKKLKVGKKVKYQASYGKLTVKRTVKVRK